ncbi:hypothetical protein, partial [Paenibacillus sp. N3.4]|uniref:hypothetical protein n=1 Tax=Paenibacillus sp. N3.4 TaxID=2603222 RepID=UPI001C9C783E
TPAHITSLFIQLIAEIFSARVSPLHYPQLIDCLFISVKVELLLGLTAVTLNNSVIFLDIPLAEPFPCGTLLRRS